MVNRKGYRYHLAIEVRLGKMLDVSCTVSRG